MGLVRGVARTAVIAGTATAVSNRVSRRQAGRWEQQEQAQAYQQQQAYEQQQANQQAYQQPPAYPPPQYQQPYQQPAYQAPAPPPQAPVGEDMVAQLRQLAELKDQGILTEEEFEAQKRKILGG
jgi:hypothetical protein